MHLSSLLIRNFKSWRKAKLDIGGLHAIVGANNAGKSSILYALDFLFNPSTKSITDETFWNSDVAAEIWVEGVFTNLTVAESEKLRPYLRDDGTFHMARSAKYSGIGALSSPYGEKDDEKILISQHYCKPQPRELWLRDDEINAANIAQWWTDRNQLHIGSASFADFLGTTSRPQVNLWKAKAVEFVRLHHDQIEWEEVWEDNPRGYANVLKATIPFFVLVPAVRDVVDESRGLKTSPFGRLLYAILDTVTGDKREEIEDLLKKVARQFNRSGGPERVPLIGETEKELNSLLCDFFGGCDLELEFQTPTMEAVFAAPRIYIDDGFRTLVGNKGHGLQRAVILAILRRYAQHVTSEGRERKRTLILAIEEPELYMHPQAQRTARRVFRRIAEGGDQVFFTTHSPLLVDVTHFDEIIRVDAEVREERGRRSVVSKAKQLSMSGMINDLERRHPTVRGRVTPESMHDLYSHAYSPTRNEGFFAKRIILVEGPTEEYCLPIYAEALGDCSFDAHDVAVIECGGKGSIDRLYRIFNELGIPCYLVFDYDKRNTKTGVIRKSKELLKLAGEPLDSEPDELYVGPFAAVFPEKWEETIRNEVEGYEELMAEAKRTLGLRDDSKPLESRYVARKLTSETPPRVPRSLEKIIRQAVKVEWRCSCLSARAECLSTGDCT